MCLVCYWLLSIIYFQGVVLFICISIFTGSVLALGAIVSAKPLDELGYKGWNGDQNSVTSPYASSVYLGWAMACVVALIVTGVLPIVSWFATYRFSISSAICVGIFAGSYSESTLVFDSKLSYKNSSPWSHPISPPKTMHCYPCRIIVINHLLFCSAFCSCSSCILWCILYGGCEF